MKAVLVSLVVATFCLSACDRGAAPPAKKAPASDLTVKLLEAGTGPRKPLRLTAEKGMKRTMSMTLDSTMTMETGGSPTTTKIPTMKMPMELAVADVSADGDIRYTFTMREPQVIADESTPSAVVDQLKSMFAGLTMSGEAVTSNRGFTKVADVKVPPDANPQIKQMVDSMKQSLMWMCAPLPEEPVGVGAKWETTTKITQNGMSLVQVATTELVSLEGNVAVTKIVLAQSADAQTITANGMTVDLQSYKGTGGGESTLDFGKLMPTTSKISMKSDMVMKAGGQQVGMGLEMAFTLTSQ